MSVRVYGCNHVAIEVDDLAKGRAFYEDVFGLKLKSSGQNNAFFQLGNHQFLAMTKVDRLRETGGWHFGLIVRDEHQIGEVRDKVTQKYGLQLIPGFRCAFRDPFGNRIDVVDLHDESLTWLLPYQEVQEAGIRFADQRDRLGIAARGKLHKLVCAGQLDLKTAQREIASDWIEAYEKYVGNSPPSPVARETKTAPANSTTNEVWVNTRSGKYWKPGSRFYGKTRRGEFMSELDALDRGYSPAGGTGQ